MKKILLLFVVCLYACPPLPRHLADSVSIHYDAITRGSSDEIDVERGVLRYVKNHRDTSFVSLNKKQLNQIYNAYNLITVDSIPLFKAPSKKFQFDGAKLTTIEVKTPIKSYKSTTFDHNNPPKELKEFVSVLQAYIK